MKKISFTVFIAVFVFLQKNVYSQNKQLGNSIGISVPTIYNNSEATYYILGKPLKSNGTSANYGININYSKNVSKNLFLSVGLGYFKQRFSIQRPTDFYDTITKLLYFTKSYEYDNLDIMFGVGYAKQLKKSTAIKVLLDYHLYHSFKQKYTPTYWPNSSNYSQINNENFNTGNSINLNLGFEKKISNKMSIGLDVILPVIVHWNNDDMFIKYAYSNTTQQIAQNKFSIGTSISCGYHF